ncbi:MAG: hypothetical protein IJV66_05930 [Firmicutes bacterium]|nr:hypothetical protein [Bacillota bacterium]
MNGTIIQKGQVSPDKLNIGILVEKLDRGAVGRLAADLAKALAEDFNTFVILLNRRESIGHATGTILDLQGGTAAFGLKLTQSSARINILIKDYGLEAVISIGDRANTVNGLYNHASPSAACVLKNGESSRLNPLGFFTGRMKKDAMKKADKVVRLTGADDPARVRKCCQAVKELISGR